MVLAEQITGGFADPVFNGQAVFRAVMDAMARPGSIQPVAVLAQPPLPLSAAAAAVALTLCDHDTPVWLDPALQSAAAVASWLGFHTGAPLANTPADAHFALVADPASLIALENFAQGTQEYPDRSTTLILQVASLASGENLLLARAGHRASGDDRADAAAAPFRRAVEAEPRAVSARRRPHPGGARRHRLPAAHHAHSSAEG